MRRRPPVPPTANAWMWRWPRTARCRWAPQPGWRHTWRACRGATPRPSLTNTGGRAATTAEAVLDDLARAVAHPVRWYDATRLMSELGMTCAIETQPGHVLTRLRQSAAPDVISISLQDNPFAAAIARRSSSAAAGRR
jgi:malonyl CoA-acyl carrier protein transacylase